MDEGWSGSVGAASGRPTTLPVPMADKIQPLLDTSFQYVQAKLGFETAITAAR
jgi:hypothetical protein